MIRELIKVKQYCQHSLFWRICMWLHII